MTRIPILRELAYWLVIRDAFREDCWAQGVEAIKATTSELRAFAALRESES